MIGFVLGTDHDVLERSRNAAVMLKAYAKWLTGSTEKDVAKINAAMEFATSLPLAAHRGPRFLLQDNDLDWRRERDSNPRYRFKPV